MSTLEQATEKKFNGLVHLYVGDGKGKTTAAVGLAVRCCGHGEKVLFCQFLKGRPTGEITQLEKLGIDVVRAKTGEKFFFQLDDDEKEQLKVGHARCLNQAAQAASDGSYRMIILDEVIDAANCGAVSYLALMELIANRAPDTEIILTGRNPEKQLSDAADYLTEFKCLKHPYQCGVAARPCVEF